MVCWGWVKACRWSWRPSIHPSIHPSALAICIGEQGHVLIIAGVGVRGHVMPVRQTGSAPHRAHRSFQELAERQSRCRPDRSFNSCRHATPRARRPMAHSSSTRLARIGLDEQRIETDGP
jgi:hypothetical protein